MFFSFTRKPVSHPQPFRLFLFLFLSFGISQGDDLEASSSLRGGRSSMDRQARAAKSHDYTYLANPSAVRRFVRKGLLVPVKGNRNFDLAGVSFPYARPEVKTFIHRLATQYKSACKEKLVVTSLTRPRSHQPRNASPRSVHPTGMALDLRRSHRRSCRRWLESTLLSLEANGILEANRERFPPHYHVALFPQQYSAYLKRKPTSTAMTDGKYRVSAGDTLWRIAQKHRTTVNRLKAANGLRSNTIQPGQVLSVPSER